MRREILDSSLWTTRIKEIEGSRPAGDESGTLRDGRTKLRIRRTMGYPAKAYSKRASPSQNTSAGIQKAGSWIGRLECGTVTGPKC